MDETPINAQLPNWHVRLRRALVEYFSEDDLETLCFDLRVDFDDLPGQNKTQKVVTLITHMSRLGRISELIDLCSEVRPNVPWGNLRAAALRHPLVVEEHPDRVTITTSFKRTPPTKSQKSNFVLVYTGILVVALCLLSSFALVWMVWPEDLVATPPVKTILVADTTATTVPTDGSPGPTPSPTETANPVATNDIPTTVVSATPTVIPPTKTFLPTNTAIPPTNTPIPPSATPIPTATPPQFETVPRTSLFWEANRAGSYTLGSDVEPIQLTAYGYSFPNFPQLTYTMFGDYEAVVTVAIFSSAQTSGARVAGFGIYSAETESVLVLNRNILRDSPFNYVSGGFASFSGLTDGLLDPLGNSTACNADLLQLKIVKSTDWVSLYCSTNGVNWVVIAEQYTLYLGEMSDLFLFTYSTDEQSITANFYDFAVLQR